MQERLNGIIEDLTEIVKNPANFEELEEYGVEQKITNNQGNWIVYEWVLCTGGPREKFEFFLGFNGKNLVLHDIEYNYYAAGHRKITILLEGKQKQLLQNIFEYWKDDAYYQFNNFNPWRSEKG